MHNPLLPANLSKAAMSPLPTGYLDMPQEAGEGRICQYCLSIFSVDDAELLLSSLKGVEYRRSFSSLAQTTQNCRLCQLLSPDWDNKTQKMSKWLRRCGLDQHGPKIRFNFQGDLKSSNRILAYRHSFFWWYWKLLDEFEVFTPFGKVHRYRLVSDVNPAKVMCI
jgi:hypothetical protein